MASRQNDSALNLTRNSRQKAPYQSPKLEPLGSLRSNTRGSGGMGADGAMGMTMMSDPRAKEDIVRIGRHPLGFGIYRFRYRPDFVNSFGSGRRVGVLANEVLARCPEAVERDSEGYLRVDYSRLIVQ